jgi:hypothetical protein
MTKKREQSEMSYVQTAPTVVVVGPATPGTAAVVASPQQQCQNCLYFIDTPQKFQFGTCAIVKGAINRLGKSSNFTPIGQAGGLVNP